MNSKEALRTAVNLTSFFGILAISLCAFTEKQRKSIAFERDEGRCHAPFKHNCNFDKLEVHHVLPQRYAKEMGLDDQYIDNPENAITICSQAHDMIHPDRVEARKNYHKDKAAGENSFEKLGRERAEKLKARQIYWTDMFDRAMKVVALKRTQEAIKAGWKFPEKRVRVPKIIELNPGELQEVPNYAAVGD